MSEGGGSSSRLPGYGYVSGAYFVILCPAGKRHLFGEIRSERMHMSEAGLIVAEEWCATGTVRPGVELRVWVLVPNHLHGIVTFSYPADQEEVHLSVGAHGRAHLQREPRSLGGTL